VELLARWFFGLGIFALGIGWLCTNLFLKVIRIHINNKATERKEAEIYNKSIAPLDVPPWLVGITERTFFVILVAFDLSATAVAMIAWITVKMLCNWNILSGDKSITVRSSAFSALLGNLVSMLFALIGGLICGGHIKYLLIG